MNRSIIAGITISLLLHGAAFLTHFNVTRPAATRARVKVNQAPSAIQSTLKPAPAPKQPAKRRKRLPETLVRISKLARPAVPALDPEDLVTLKKPIELVKIETQPARAASHPGARTKACAKGQLCPAYPNVSRRLGEEGQVIILAKISDEGNLIEAQILHSSDHSRLDRAALATIKKAQFNPATRNGEPIACTQSFTFHFRLKDTA